ncbi:MAG TPA: T9SS type A sorting domain-containing protein [Flavobacteriales bacterium]|nr:T9SS type A sorting domain-containing protein [Flavobacteriales bacterium]
MTLTKYLIKIYTLESNEPIGTIFVRDVSGKTVFSKTGIQEQKTNMNLSHLQRGVYFIEQITSLNGHAIQKIIID